MKTYITSSFYEKTFPDFYSDININFFLRAIDYHLVFSYDQDFEFKILTLRFESAYYRHSIFAKNPEHEVRKAAHKHIQHLEKINKSLPNGIQVCFEEEATIINESFNLCIYVKISVSSQYSKNRFNLISENNILHIDVAKKHDAITFKNHLSNHPNRIVQFLINAFNWDNTIYISQEYYYSKVSPVDEDFDKHCISYNNYGFKNLQGIEQCYGLAWVVANELSNDNHRFRISVEQERFYDRGQIKFREVVKLSSYLLGTYPPLQTEKNTQYAEW